MLAVVNNTRYENSKSKCGPKDRAENFEKDGNTPAFKLIYAPSQSNFDVRSSLTGFTYMMSTEKKPSKADYRKDTLKVFDH